MQSILACSNVQSGTAGDQNANLNCVHSPLISP